MATAPGGLRFPAIRLPADSPGPGSGELGHLPPGAGPASGDLAGPALAPGLVPGAWPFPVRSACRSLVRPPGSEVRCTLAPIRAPRVLQAQPWCLHTGPQVGSEALRVQPGFPWASPGPWGYTQHPLSGFPRSGVHLLPQQRAAVGAVPLSRFPGGGIPPASSPGAHAATAQGFSKAWPPVFAHGGRGRSVW